MECWAKKDSGRDGKEERRSEWTGRVAVLLVFEQEVFRSGVSDSWELGMCSIPAYKELSLGQESVRPQRLYETLRDINSRRKIFNSLHNSII